MRRSRLEKYVSILEALVHQPLELGNMSFNTNIECRALRNYIRYLISQNLVEENQTKSRTCYAITDRGITVFKTLQAQKYFKKLKQILPVLED